MTHSRSIRESERRREGETKEFDRWRRGAILIVVIVTLFYLGRVLVRYRPPGTASVPPFSVQEPGMIAVAVVGDDCDEGNYFLQRGAVASDLLKAAGYRDAVKQRDGARPLSEGDRVTILGDPPLLRFDTMSAADRIALGVPLDINRAKEKELQLIPGIGPVRSAAIVAYRTSHGAFASVEDIVRIPGIGTKTCDRIGRYLIVESDGE